MLADMEYSLSYEDIRFFRSVARAQAKRDAATRRKLEAEKVKNQPKKQTWGEWMWGGAPGQSTNGGLSEEEKKELDEIIDFDPQQDVTVGSTPQDFIRARVSATLKSGSFALKAEPKEDSDIISVIFDSFTANGTQLTDSMSGRLALGGFRVYDGTTPDSIYPQIVRVKALESKSSVDGRQRSLEVGREQVMSELSEGARDEADPFFTLEIEQNPLDGRADNAVAVRMRHLEIIYHRGYVEAVYQFFKPPESQLESINALLDAAGQTLEGIRKETRAGLEYALEQHKTIDLRVDMNAPIIIIPME